MAIYRVKSGAFVRRGKTYKEGENFTYVGPLPLMLKSKVECVKPDPPSPAPSEVRLRPFAVNVLKGGWYAVLDENGKQLHDKNLRREAAVALAGEEAVAKAEGKEEPPATPPTNEGATNKGAGETGESKPSEGEGNGEGE